MREFCLLVLFTTLFSFTTVQLQAQCTGWNTLQTADSIFTNPIFGIATTPEADKLYRPYVYLATVAGGVKIYDNNIAGSPTLTSTVTKSSLGNLAAINLYQDSIWLYVCLGDIWDTTELSGLAIIDVSNPATPVVLDVYTYPGLKGGAGAVKVRGNYAYLAANKNGIVILDISNKSNIQFKGALAFTNNFPHTTPGAASMYNARGIDLKGNYAFVCYDRGGLRVVDISNVNLPVQTNQYCYAPLIDHATAYNNIVIHNNLAYVTLDYYGMEILDISNPNNIVQLGWWHPNTWADTTNDYNTWANSKGHANELAYDSTCNMLYIAAGKSDVVAIDVSNPALPATCETYGSTTDDYGTWGLDFFDHKVNIAYIWSPAFTPFSNYTGYKVLQTTCNANYINENNSINNVVIFPNPANDMVHINISEKELKGIRVFSLTGVLLQEYFTADFSIKNFADGVYVVIIQTGKSVYINKIVKQ